MEKFDDNYVFSLCLPDPAEAVARLDRARFEFESLLDYCLTNHCEAVPADFVQDSYDELFHLSQRFNVMLDVS